jgi:hypothetical protein
VERLLIGLGLALVAFGALVLLRFPTRPGGKVRLLGMEVSSVGAGLPLVALGVLTVLVPVLNQREGGSESDGGSGGGEWVAGPPPGNAPACTASFLASPPEVPRNRQRTLDEGRESVDVLAATEPKRDEFGVFLVDAGKVVGVAKLAYDGDAKQFRVDGIVDGECQPVEWSSDDVPGLDPRKLADYETVRLRTPGDYFLELQFRHAGA